MLKAIKIEQAIKQNYRGLTVMVKQVDSNYVKVYFLKSNTSIPVPSTVMQQLFPNTVATTGIGEEKVNGITWIVTSFMGDDMTPEEIKTDQQNNKYKQCVASSDTKTKEVKEFLAKEYQNTVFSLWLCAESACDFKSLPIGAMFVFLDANNTAYGWGYNLTTELHCPYLFIKTSDSTREQVLKPNYQSQQVKTLPDQLVLQVFYPKD